MVSYLIELIFTSLILVISFLDHPGCICFKAATSFITGTTCFTPVATSYWEQHSLLRELVSLLWERVASRYQLAIFFITGASLLKQIRLISKIAFENPVFEDEARMD